MDYPDGRRKIHRQPIPLAGGLAILTSLLFTFLILLLSRDGNQIAAILGREHLLLAGLLLAVAIVFAAGIADDLQLIRGRHKLLAQILAVGVLLLSGCVVRRLGLLGFEVELGFLAYPFTAFWLLGAINAFNLLDGMDGLLGTVSGWACAALTAIGLIVGDSLLAITGAALTGAVLGFLRYNLPPARVFLGDSGSMVLGLMVGVLSLRAAALPHSGLSLVPAWGLVLLPVLDTTAAIVRRTLTGRSLYATDRGHIHHVLLRRGFGPWKVLAILGGLACVAASGTALSRWLSAEYPAVVGLTVVLMVLLATGWFGWPELHLLANHLRHTVASLFRGPNRDAACELQVHLHGRAAWRELWRALTEFAMQANLQSVWLDVSLPALNEEYHARWDRPHSPGEVFDLWTTTIPLTAGDHVIGRLEIRGRRDQVPVCERILQVAHFVEGLERAALAVTSSQSEAHAVPTEQARGSESVGPLFTSPK